MTMTCCRPRLRLRSESTMRSSNSKHRDLVLDMRSRSSFCPSFLHVCLWLLLLTCFESGLCYKDGLYATEDNDVIPLNSETFKKLVIDDAEGIFWVVEFYNSWCGHCIHFAPTWKLVAHSFQDWSDLVKVAAIDCSQANNLGVCRDFDIDKYPSIKVFSPWPKDKKRQVQPIESQELLTIRREVMKLMTNLTPSDWPRLTPLVNMEDIWEERKPSHTYISLIFEEDSSFLGTEVVLDMRHVSNLLVRRMNKGSVKKFGITKFPSLYKMSTDVGYSLMAVGRGMLKDDRKMFVSLLNALSKGQGIETASDDAKDKNSLSKSANERKIDKKSSPHYNCTMVSMQDLESALHYSFRQEIAICKLIDGDRFVALQNFITVLLKYFPGRPQVLAFLKKVVQLLKDLPKNALTGEEWLDQIDQLQDDNQFLPDVIQWECCKGSQPRYRGYPCGMWTLFHTLTIAAYYQNKNQARATSPIEVPQAIRGYMKHFFGCEECSKNFLAMSFDLEEKIKDQRTAVLWLWSAHNSANKRLSGDVSEDPAFPKIQFPSYKACPGCYLINAGRKIVKDTWNEETVLTYLVNFYSEKNIGISSSLNKRPFVLGGPSASQSRERKWESRNESSLDWWEKKQNQQDLQLVERFRVKKRENAKQGSYKISILGSREGFSGRNRAALTETDGWNFTHLDLSMCVVFYIISTVIILMLYHHFIIRRTVFSYRNLCFRA